MKGIRARLPAAAGSPQAGFLLAAPGALPGECSRLPAALEVKMQNSSENQIKGFYYKIPGFLGLRPRGRFAMQFVSRPVLVFSCECGCSEVELLPAFLEKARSLSEISPSEKDKYHMASPICGI